MHRLINSVLLIFALVQFILAQGNETSFNPDSDVPFFYYDAIAYPVETRDSIRMEIFIKVPFDAIQFLKDGAEFVSRYEISLLLFNEDEVQAASRIWTQEVRTKSFGETGSREHFDINRVNFMVRPGNYLLTIGVMDMDTRKRGFRKKKIDVKDMYDQSIVISRINLIERIIERTEGKDELIPAVIGSVSDVDSIFHISFSVLSDGGEGIIHYSIYSMKSELITEKTLKCSFKKGITEKILAIPKKELSFNKYRLKVFIKLNGNSASSERMFKMRWIGMSNFIDNLDEAIEQLKYIAPQGVIKTLRKGTQQEKKKAYLEFWKKKDPTPNTRENELMNEYFRRVQYSNEHFSGFQKGWRTDMGMIFILFGPPNDVERYPFEIQSKPYEIWHYYEINRDFLFVDESGFGEYRLISPILDIPGMY